MALSEKEVKERAKIQKRMGTHIAKIRESKGINSAELARRCDMERSNLARIEMGRSGLSLYTLHRIARALELSVSELVRQFEEK